MKMHFLALLMAAMVGPSLAQWLNYPTPGIPRTPDGKPNLSAPAPRTADGKPDFSGVWRIGDIGYGANIAGDLRPEDVLPWAASLQQQRLENLGVDNPQSGCLPSGIQSITGGIGTLLAKIVQTPTLIVVLGEPLDFRQIFLDGRGLPKDPNPSFMGYSVGHWDGDTLVVETAGFNDRTWLDLVGHPHTEALHITERWLRKDYEHIALQLTLEDPGAYAKAWTIPIEARLQPDTELLEYVCNENEKDSAHLIGRTAEERITVPPAILAQYAGRYELESPNPNVRLHSIDVTLSGGRLLLDVDGKGKIPLVPLTTSIFTLRAAEVEFVRDGQGRVTHAILYGMVRLVRTRMGK